MTRTDAEDGWMELTEAQLDFWEEHVLHGSRPVSTVAHCVALRGPVDEAALVAAIGQATHEAEVLSVRFGFLPGRTEPVQRCDPDRVPVLERIDLRDRADPVAAAQALMQADVDAPLDLLAQPVTAQWLLRVGEGHWLWYLRAHHILLDGYGMALIEQRCAQLYAHFLRGAAAGESFGAFRSFLDEAAAYRAGKRFAADRAYWRECIAEWIGEMPVLRKGGEDYGAAVHHGERALPAEAEVRLRAMAERTGIGWPDLLVLLTGLYLLRRDPTAAEEGARTLWLPQMNRWGSVGAHVPSLAVNLLPFRMSAAADETLAACLERGAGELRRMRRHGRYRIERIAADHGLAKGTRYYFSPLVNVLPFDPPDFAALEARREVLASGNGDGVNVTFRGRSDGSDLSVDFDVDAVVMSEGAFEQMWEGFADFLPRALAEEAPGARLGDLLRAETEPA